jgi:hypothetical protein
MKLPHRAAQWKNKTIHLNEDQSHRQDAKDAAHFIIKTANRKVTYGRGEDKSGDLVDPTNSGGKKGAAQLA